MPLRTTGPPCGPDISKNREQDLMTNTNEQDKFEEHWFYDMNRAVVEVKNNEGFIRIFAWIVTEDSIGRPYQTTADTVDLTPRQAIELARRLLNAVNESKEGHL